jgi:hypothetical protein
MTKRSSLYTTTFMRGAYGNPEAPAEESEMNLALLEDIAPTVQRLVAGLPPAEQAAVLRSKIQTLQPYASAPVIGFFARQRISQYQARLSEVEKSAGYQRAIEQKTNLIYTFGIIIAASVALMVGTKAIKEIKS